MGKGRIVANLGEGSYDLDAVYDDRRVLAETARITARLEALTGEIADADSAVNAAYLAMTAARDALSAAIAGLRLPSPVVTQADVNRAQQAWIQSQGVHAAAVSTLATLRLQRTSCGLSLARYGRTPSTIRHAGAWCADYTTDLATGAEVATIEIDGEKDLVLVAPAGPAHTAQAGQLQQVFGGPASAAAWNWAMLPGWQKWRPTFRFATITALDTEADTADVALLPAASSAQGLDVNQAAVLLGVPVSYMTCNASAFEVGDVVVVEFMGQDWSRPRIIGFRDNPRGCGWIEDWGETLCANHVWAYSPHDLSESACPGVPSNLTDGYGSSDLSISSGVLTLSMAKTATGPGGLRARISLSSDEEDAPVLRNRTMRITATVLNGSIPQPNGCGVCLLLKDGTGYQRYFVFGGSVNHYVDAYGDNDLGPAVGTEISVDLGACGFSAGPLDEVVIEAWAGSFYPSGIVSMALDRLRFD